MKRGLLSLLISIFFFLLLGFISYYYSPFEKGGIEKLVDRYGVTEETEFKEIISKSINLGIAWEFINIRNMSAWILALAGSVISSFVSIHLGIDKFFFKEYYQQPDFKTALRRGIMMFFIIFIFLALHLLGAFVWYTVAISILLLLLIEIGFTSIKRSSPKTTLSISN